MSTWLLGLVLALLNCILSSSGFVLQRKAHLLSDQDAETNVMHSALWAAGVALYLLAALPDVLAYTMIPQVICTTVACFRLVILTAMAHFCLSEPVYCREVCGMLACSVGTFLVLCFGPSKRAASTANDFYHPEVVSYMTVGGIVLALVLLVEHAEVLGIGLWKRTRILTLPFATGLAFALEKVFNTEIGSLRMPDSISSILHGNVWTQALIAIGLLGLIDFYLNLRAVRHLPIQVFVPAAFAFGTTLQFFQSVAIFRELSQMGSLEAYLSIAGALVSLAGALCIQPFDFDEICPSQDDESGDLEAQDDGDNEVSVALAFEAQKAVINSELAKPNVGMHGILRYGEDPAL